jgi:hypothetical protein
MRWTGRCGGAARADIATASASGRTSPKRHVAFCPPPQGLFALRASMVPEATANTGATNVDRAVQKYRS